LYGYYYKPINCWCPAQFTDSHRDYSDAICWVSNTYYLPIEQTIPEERFDVTKNRQLISYYQWVPLILLFQVRYIVTSSEQQLSGSAV